MKTKLIIELETSNIKKVLEEDGEDITDEIENEIHAILKEEILGLQDKSSNFFEEFENRILEENCVESYDSLNDYGDIIIKVNKVEE